MKITKLNDDFMFCNGEICVDDFSIFIDSLPKIDLVYCATPNPDTLNYWHINGVGNKAPYSYDKFIRSLFDIFKQVGAPEYHIEVDKNREIMKSMFKEWGKFKYIQELPLIYSAPLNSRSNGVAKRRKTTHILHVSDVKSTMHDYTYSHEYLDDLLQTKDNITCFDPCIGKGLLSRICYDFEHKCYGIDLDSKRLNCGIDYLKNKMMGDM